MTFHVVEQLDAANVIWQLMRTIRIRVEPFAFRWRMTGGGALVQLAQKPRWLQVVVTNG